MKSLRTLSRLAGITAIVFVGSNMASENNNNIPQGQEKKPYKIRLQANKGTYVRTVQDKGKILFDHAGAGIGILAANRLCDEDQDFEKAFVESTFAMLDRDEDEQMYDFVTNMPINWTTRKVTRALNSQGINSAVVGKTCEKIGNVVPKDWEYTRWIFVDPTVSLVKKATNVVTQPQIITEAAKFVIASYLAKTN